MTIMESMRLLVIGGVDLTSYIPVGKYKVNREYTYNEWTDGNYTKHRDVVRTTVKGSFTLIHHSLEEYETFIQLVQSSQSKLTSEIPITVYLNNESTTVTSTFFITFDPENYLPYIGTDKYEGFEVTIEEK